MSPTVNFGDSGELIAAASTLAIPHSPGYPLYCLLGRLAAELFPWGSWAYAVNFSSVLCAAAALAIFWDAARRTLAQCGGSPAEARAAVLGASLGTFWLGTGGLWLNSSLQAEVFALNGLLAASALWLLCRYPDRLFDSRPMSALGLCLGLGGANHHTLILIVPALLGAGAFASRPSSGRLLRGLLHLLAFALLGLALYAYLPLRSRLGPCLDWGHPADWKGFLHVLLRKDYGSFSLTVEGAQGGRWAAIPAQSLRFAKAAYAGFGPLGTALAGFGFFAWLGRSEVPRLSRWAPALWIVLSGPAFLWLGNPPSDPQTAGALERFFLLPWIGLAWLAAVGAGRLLALLPASPGQKWLGAAAVLGALIPCIAAAAGAPAWSLRDDLAAKDYGDNLLRSLPPGAALFMDGGDDTFYTLAYLRFAEGRRRDLVFHDRGGLVYPNPYGPDFRALPKAEKEPRRFLVEAAAVAARPTFYATLQDAVLPGHELGLWGLLRRPRPAPRAPLGTLRATPEDRSLWAAYPLRLSPARARAHYRYRALVPVYAVLRAGSDAAGGRFGACLSRLADAAQLGADALWLGDSIALRAQWAGFGASGAGDWALAERAYRLALSRRPGDESIRLNLGVSLEKLGRRDQAEALYREQLTRSPRSYRAHFSLGALFWSEEKWERAAEAFEEAARIDPASGEARLFAGKARARSPRK